MRFHKIILTKGTTRRNYIPEVRTRIRHGSGRTSLPRAFPVERLIALAPLRRHFPPRSLPPFPLAFARCRAENGRSRHTGDPLGIPFVTAAEGEIDLSRDRASNSSRTPAATLLACVGGSDQSKRDYERVTRNVNSAV